jgi:hypothetical protein
LRKGNLEGELMIAFQDWKVDEDHQLGWSEAAHNFVELESVVSNFEKGLTMKSLLAFGYGRAASDPRDAIFSLISMAKETKNYDWKIDYSDSIMNCFQDAVETLCVPPIVWI